MDNLFPYNYIQIGEKIWYKNPLDSPTDMPYLLSKIKYKNDLNQICDLLNGESVSYSNTLPYFNDLNINIDDLLSLDNINDMDILNNSLNRFNSKIYFTNLGDILLFFNPYINKEQIYNNKILFLYNKKNLSALDDIDIQPHLYKNIFNIIKKLKEGKNNKQTVLIQGEACTGKSDIINQSIKYILNYLHNTNFDEKNNDNKDYIQINNEDHYYYNNYNYQKFREISNDKFSKKIIASNIILDAFGNAKTINNINSTRFIKYIKLKFDKNLARILGGEIYDKHRVSNLEPNKGNNFNIFYYLIKCGNSDFLRKLFLFSDSISNYNYLRSSITSIDNSTYTKSDIKLLKEAFITLGFNNGEMFTIFKIISSIILLGNVKIKSDNKSKILLYQNESFLNICNLLNINPNEFISSLINQEETTEENKYNNINQKNSTFFYDNGNNEIENNKNNFANELYNQLFLWLINKINNNLNDISYENEDEKSISFFDFGGYENNYSYKYNDIIYLNSLEQLFINYINELLFYFYLKDYYLTNLKFLEKEGINSIADKVKNEYNNKKDILNSINYLLNDLKTMQNDEEIKVFISNLEKDTQGDLNSKKKYKKVKQCKIFETNSNPNYFLIHHTHEDVYYNLNGFMNKNTKNYIPWNLLDCLLKSINPIIRNIYKNNRINFIKDQKYNDKTLSYNYENIMNNGFMTFTEEYKLFIKEIKKEIKQSQRDYIICFKTNQNQKPLVFTPNYVFNQIKYYKILFSVKQFEKNILPIIIDFMDFYQNFKFSQDIEDITEFEDMIKYDVDTNSANSTDIFKKECSHIINDLITSYNKFNNKNIILNEYFILFGKKKILMKEKIYNILVKEKNRRIEIKTKAIKNIILGLNLIFNKEYFKESKNKKIFNSISNIKQMIKSYYNKNKIQKYSDLIYFLQNSLRILIARNRIEKIKTKKIFLTMRLKIYLERIKKNNIKNILNLSSKKSNKNSNNNFNDYSQNESSRLNNNKDNGLKINNSNSYNKLENRDNSFKNNLNNNSWLNNNYSKREINNNKENSKNNLYINDGENQINDNRITIINNEKNINEPEKLKNQNQNEILIDNNTNKLKVIKKEKRLSVMNQNFLNNIDVGKYKKKESINLMKKEKKSLNLDQIKSKYCLKILQENYLFNKIEKQKKSIKIIYNNSYSKIFSKYYISMKKNIKIIQNYIVKYLETQRILNEALYKYMDYYIKKANEIDKKINSILFPYRKKNLSKKEIKREKNTKDSLENNKMENLSIKNRENYKYSSTFEKYQKYKQINKLYEYSEGKKINLDKNEEIENSQQEGNVNLQSSDIYNNNFKDMNNSLNDEEEKEECNIIYKIIKEIPNLSVENLENNPEKENLYNNKLYFLSKIIDIDILTEIAEEEDKEYQILWAQEYKKIYEFNLINRTPIQQIYLSDRHTLLINNIGNIFLFGFNEKRQCGFFPNNYLNEENKSENLNFIYSDVSLSLYKYFHNLYGNIQKAILGDEYTILLNNQGKLFSFGKYLNINSLNNQNNFDNCLSFLNGNNMQNIKIINGNGNLNIYLKNNNDIFIDLAPYNILNPNNNPKNSFNLLNKPFKIFLDKKIKISTISCGHNFYILLSTEGKLYSGGSNSHGELCSSIDNLNYNLNPTEIYEISKLNEKIIQVSCGFKHVIILSSNNNVYGWGNNSYGQIFSKDICRKSRIIKFNNDEKNIIIQISAGFRSSFIMNDNNEIYFFGVLNRNKKNMTGVAQRIFIEEKNNEFANKCQFVPIKINNRWNKLFSLFYITFADIRNYYNKREYMNEKNENETIKKILSIVSSRWLNDSIKLTYIPEISQYFNENYMEKPHKVKK